MAAENLDTIHIDPTGREEARTSFNAATIFKQLMTEMVLEFVFLLIVLFTDFLVIVLENNMHHFFFIY